MPRPQPSRTIYGRVGLRRRESIGKIINYYSMYGSRTAEAIWPVMSMRFEALPPDKIEPMRRLHPRPCPVLYMYQVLTWMHRTLRGLIFYCARTA